MKVIKKIGLVLLAIIAIALIIALFLKKDYVVSREVVINKPKQDVFNYIKFLKNQDTYSKWAAMDVNMVKTYSGTDGTVGFVSAWDSNIKDVGKGEQTIKKITEGVSVDYLLHFIKPFEDVAEATMATVVMAPNQTKVTWAIKGKMPYPMNLMQLFMNMDKMIGDDLVTGLNNLKVLLEK
jgi:uncharacterized membrane protein